MLVFVCSVIIAVVPSADAAYPERPVEIVVHSAAGSGTDTFARTMAAILAKEKIIKQRMVISNRVGGGGVVAMDYLASQKGNPHVLGITTASPLFTIIRKVSVLRWEDITWISNLGFDPSYVTAKYDAPYKNLKELVAWSKTIGRDVNLAIGSVGGFDHIAAYRLGQTSGMKVNIIGFGGSAPSAVALLGGHADIRVGVWDHTMEPEAKQLRALSINAAERNSQAPDIPTSREEGFDVTGAQYRGFMAPPDFPDYAIKFWEDATKRLANSLEFQKYLAKNNVIARYMPSKEIKATMDEIAGTVGEDLKKLGLFEEKKKK